MLRRCTLLFLGSPALFALRAWAATTNITSSADTTLSENWPSNNFGGMTFANSGTTQNFTRNRALFRFDVASAVPAGSRIKSATLVLEVVGKPQDGYNFADFGLNRVLVAWGEGNKITPTNSLNAGTGSPATTNEATWFYRFAFTTNTWSVPGGAPTTDYSPTVSASQTIYALGDSPYSFGPTSQTAADAQFWLDHPQQNFGWMLLCESEGMDFTARRFGTHENLGFAPQLQLEFLISPRIDRIERSGNESNLYFTAQPSQTYVVQYRSNLAGGTWQTLVTIQPQADVTPVRVVDITSDSQRFYRLSSY